MPEAAPIAGGVDAGSPSAAAGGGPTPPSNSAIQAAFKQTRMTRVLVASVEKRLGFKGIRVRKAEEP